MEWEGEPEAFALSYPYVVAFEPGFIEIRNIITVRKRSQRDSSLKLTLNFLNRAKWINAYGARIYDARALEKEAFKAR